MLSALQAGGRAGAVLPGPSAPLVNAPEGAPAPTAPPDIGGGRLQAPAPSPHVWPLHRPLKARRSDAHREIHHFLKPAARWHRARSRCPAAVTTSASRTFRLPRPKWSPLNNRPHPRPQPPRSRRGAVCLQRRLLRGAHAASAPPSGPPGPPALPARPTLLWGPSNTPLCGGPRLCLVAR